MDYNLYRLEIGDQFKIYIDKIKSIYKYKPYKKKYYGKIHGGIIKKTLLKSMRNIKMKYLLLNLFRKVDYLLIMIVEKQPNQ